MCTKNNYGSVCAVGKNETTTNVTLVNGSQMLKTIPHAMENSKLANSAKVKSDAFSDSILNYIKI